jgi:hypothetical protein
VHCWSLRGVQETSSRRRQAERTLPWCDTTHAPSRADHTFGEHSCTTFPDRLLQREGSCGVLSSTRLPDRLFLLPCAARFGAAKQILRETEVQFGICAISQSSSMRCTPSNAHGTSTLAAKTALSTCRDGDTGSTNPSVIHAFRQPSCPSSNLPRCLQSRYTVRVWNAYLLHR